jgi:ribosome-associated protein
MYFKPPFLNPEFIFKASRSSGKGGQNVNKLSTKVQIDFNIASSHLLRSEEKQVLLDKLKGKISADGMLQVSAQADRSQLRNKTAAIRKMYAILNACFVQRKKRKATRPTAASVEARLKAKQHKKKQKEMRREKYDVA